MFQVVLFLAECFRCVCFPILVVLRVQLSSRGSCVSSCLSAAVNTLLQDVGERGIKDVKHLCAAVECCIGLSLVPEDDQGIMWTCNTCIWTGAALLLMDLIAAGLKCPRFRGQSLIFVFGSICKSFCLIIRLICTVHSTVFMRLKTWAACESTKGRKIDPEDWTRSFSKRKDHEDRMNYKQNRDNWIKWTENVTAVRKIGTWIRSRHIYKFYFVNVPVSWQGKVYTEG